MYIWSWFCQIKAPGVPLSNQELQAWASMNGLSLLAHEIQTLKQLDLLHRSVYG